MHHARGLVAAPRARTPTERRHVAICTRAGIALLAVGAFVVLTRELVDRDVDAVDLAVLRAVARRRRGWLTAAARDVSALGSPVVLAAFTTVAVVVLATRRRRADALQVLAASTGAAMLSKILKHVVARQRPTIVQRLAWSRASRTRAATRWPVAPST